MDSLGGYWPECDSDSPAEEGTGEALPVTNSSAVTPPPARGQDERRMQVRAYNFWASLLGERQLPTIADFERRGPPDFAAYGVLLDFSSGIDDPEISLVGEELARECRADQPIRVLGEVPAGSLLSCITDNYRQIFDNPAPIGFASQYVNAHQATILYRAILLPFSDEGTRVDQVYGVINWKEVADTRATAELIEQVDEALEPRGSAWMDAAPLTEWADGPADFQGDALDHHLASGLRALAPVPLSALPGQGDEFAIAVVRRLASGEVVVLGEVAQDPALLERAARHLLG